MRKRAASLVFTCEHASNRIPARFREVEKRAGKQLDTHRGYDPGALELAKRFAWKFSAPLFVGKWSRLLIELNRSRHHPKLWSEFSNSLPADQKEELVEHYYLPYRESVERSIGAELERGRQVIHIGVHSFTPVLNGEVRNADIGLLYDPRRPDERAFCGRWAGAIRNLEPGLRVRKNYPYRGIADGFTTHLRKQFAEEDYVGIELEVNQRFPAGPSEEWKRVQRTLVASLAPTMGAVSERHGRSR